MVVSYCPDCGYESWGLKPEIRICCGYYLCHKEVEESAKDRQRKTSRKAHEQIAILSVLNNENHEGI